jgi:hypothetical protein
MNIEQVISDYVQAEIEKGVHISQISSELMLTVGKVMREKQAVWAAHRKESGKTKWAE